ncbi:MAG TPA: hypothetical protein VGP82_25025 [Ktedonobacterales bacterium]|jgi:hypothetical protein|nr:hypothetical protein [Ktedonobacterales bacterium]
MVKGEASQARRPVLALTITLAVIFLILGEAAYESGQLLQHALHPQTSADVAALVCTSLKTQNYAQLSSKLDPAATPTATNTKEPTLSDQLRGLDSSKGKVTTCTYQLLSENDTSAQYALTVKRTKMPVPMGLLLALRFHSGTWMISPETDFTGQPR